MSYETARQIFAQGLEPVLDHARENGILVLIEPEPDLLLETSEQYLEFIDEFNHPNLGLNFDIGHFFCAGENPVETVIKLQDHTEHYHLEDIPETREHMHIIPGTGAIDIEGVLEAIEKTGYKGFITIELYPYLDEPETAAKDALRYIKKLS